MKRTWSLVLLFLLLVSFYEPLYAQIPPKEIRMEVKRERLPQVLKRLEKISGYKFLFVNADLHQFVFDGVVRANSIQEAMKIVFGSHPLEYTIDGQFITINLKKHVRSTKLAHISDVDKWVIVEGKVIDKHQNPLPGVNITSKNQDRGTISRIDGTFELTLVKGQLTDIDFSFIGMKTEKMAISCKEDKIGLTIMMEEEDAKLDEVVITGIFKKAKESYTGAVSSISSEQLEIYKGQNLLQTLKNIDTSINFAVNNLVGSNPNALPQINIRGNSSLPTTLQEYNENVRNDANTPLIIMDGFEISLSRLMDYNDEEIQSINILKDAAATAIYGSRGSNGVIVIVTKQPEIGRLRINAEVGMDFEVPDLNSYNLLNAAEKLELERVLGLYNNTASPNNDVWYKEAYYKRLRDVLSGVDTDWLSKPLRTGVGTHYNLRLEGGSEEFRWSATAAYKNVEGAMKGSSRKNFNGSITLMYNVKNLIFKNYTSYGINRGQESKYGSFSTYVQQQPYNAPYTSDGELVRYFDGFHKMSAKVQNPLYDATLNSFDKNGYNTLTNNFSIEWNPLDGLTMRGQLGISGTDNTSDIFLPAEHSTFTEDDYYESDEGFLRRGRYTYGTGTSYNYTGNLTLSYNKTFRDIHQLYVGVDYSLAESNSTSYQIIAEGFTNADINFLASARQYEKDGSPTGSKSKTRRFGLTGNVNYILDNRYYVDLSFRMDGSSTFGSEKKYAPFWSTGIGWNLHNEAFIKDHFQLANILRLKASYGQTGTQQGSSTGSTTTYKYLTDNKYMNWTGAVLQGWGNPYLTWQKTDEFNVGLEFGLLNGRIKGELDVYTKKTSNLLSYMDIPYSMGFSSYLSNVGEVKNRGWEAALSGYLIRDPHRRINWMVGAQLVYNKNYISKLSEAIKQQTEERVKQDVEIDNLLYEGRPQNAIYAVRSLGIDPSTGKEVFLDKDGNQTDTWSPSDKVFLGSRDPKFRGNANTMFMWKGFTVNMSVGFYWGGQVYNSTLIDRVEVPLSTLQYQNVDARVYYDRWKNSGDVVSFKAFDNTKTRATSRFVMDDNVFEIQSIGLQYRWDSEWLKKHTSVTSITFGMNMSDILHLSTVKMERGTNYPYARNIQGSVKFLF